jgi:hypothetical protein
MKLNPVIGQRTFPDGTSLPVYQDGQGLQYILDTNGWRRYGNWVSTEPPPVAGTTVTGSMAQTQC